MSGRLAEDDSSAAAREESVVLIDDTDRDPAAAPSAAVAAAGSQEADEIGEADEAAMDVAAAAAAGQESPLSMAQLWRSPAFLTLVYSLPSVAALSVSLCVDWRRGCTSRSIPCSCSPLKQWAITQAVLQSFLALLNAIVVQAITSRPLADVMETMSFRVVNVLSHLLDIGWFVWFIFGAVWTFRYSAECRQTTPFLYSCCYAVTITGFVLLGLAALSCVCLCALCFIRDSVLRRLARMGLDRVGPFGGGARGATEETIDGLSSVPFDPSLMDKSDSNCAICLFEYQSGQTIAFLPCRHHFHKECVSTWLTTDKHCPFCKHAVDEPFTGSGPAGATELELRATSGSRDKESMSAPAAASSSLTLPPAATAGCSSAPSPSGMIVDLPP